MDPEQLIGSIVLIIVAYLAGAVPWGVVVGRLLTGVDLRSHGSGSIGTTNALRVYGWRISVAVLVLDLLKGALPVVIGRIAHLPWWAIATAAVAAVVGHCWSIFIKGSGGKGMATGGAAVIALTPWGLVALPVMLGVVLITRFVSLASVMAAALVPPFFAVLAIFGLLNWWVVAATVAIGAIILIKHWGNIDRLRRGTERKIGERAATGARMQAGRA